MKGIASHPLAFTLLAIGIFFLAISQRAPVSGALVEIPGGKIVISAPVQLIMYAGDRFLAANLETMRVAAIGPAEEEVLAGYRIRAHDLVSQLNPCHEDNFYLANAMLSWGGAAHIGNTILERSTECRYWDDIPPFLLGFNRYFFFQDYDGAHSAIEIAAQRSSQNRASLQNIAVGIKSRQINDEGMALSYLRHQSDETTDPRLKAMIERRIARLEGLFLLRQAQQRYEEDYQRPLDDPNKLIASNILQSFPQDPMRIGYEFKEGRFELRPLRIGGMEIR